MLEIERDLTLPALSADSYPIEIRNASIVYQRTQLVRSALPWRYEGVLHEYLTCDGAGSAGQQLSGIRMQCNHDGARRKDPETYRRDANVLEGALRAETNPFLLARYRFTWRKAIATPANWKRHWSTTWPEPSWDFWQEEVFISLYSAAQLKERLGHPGQDVIDAYLRAADAAPSTDRGVARGESILPIPEASRGGISDSQSAGFSSRYRRAIRCLSNLGFMKPAYWMSCQSTLTGLGAIGIASTPA